MSMNNKVSNTDEVSIVLCGQAGQGIQTVEFILTRLAKLAGYNVFATKEYMSRIRGGANSTQIRISARPVTAPVDRIDYLIALNKGAVPHLEKRITGKTIILADKEDIGSDFDPARHRFVDAPFNKLAMQLGNRLYSNVVAVGAIAGLLTIDPQLLTDFIEKFFAAKPAEVVQRNIQAAKVGSELARELAAANHLRLLHIAPDDAVKNHLLLGGTEAVALGAIAGGCNFATGYPMTPSTGVLTFLAAQADRFGLVVEQAEDEIAAINMVLGAWYAGARAYTGTSGGGFALMVEGLSLAGMLESPAVIMLGQRPAPATGLPTRTEQADLLFALYAGHGEFPRIILAPGCVEQAFCLTQKAFNLADKFQVPVLILTDQYLMDSYYNIPALDTANLKVEKYITETGPDYRRYEITDTGVSPRGIPGLGTGTVVLDSDEHDQAGHITEDLDLRTQMVDKRLRKFQSIKTECLPPRLEGPADYKTLLICWGSTFHAVNTARQLLPDKKIALLHFAQVFPLHDSAAQLLKKAEKLVIIENNATSQFAKLLRTYTGVNIEHKILKYNGLTFSIEELVDKLSAL